MSYTKPELEIIEFKSEDIITTSSDINVGGETGGDSSTNTAD